MPFPQYKDASGFVRSVKTASGSAAGTNIDPDIHASVPMGRTQIGVYVLSPCNTEGNIIGGDFLFEVARGNVPGIAMASVYGYNPDSKTAVEECVSDISTAYTFPAAAGTVTISSSSGADTGAGTGAQTVLISGLDAAYLPVSELVILTGAVPVVTTQTFLRFQDATVQTAGSGGKNAGVLTATLGGNPQCAIPIGSNTSQLGFYTVPAGFTAYIIQADFAISEGAVATARGTLFIRPFGGVFIIRDNYVAGSSTGQVTTEYRAPIIVTEKSDVIVNAIASANTELFIRLDVIRVTN
jgi:hypothetical protein